VKNFEKFDCCGDSDVRPKTHTLDCPNRIDKNIHVTPLQESLQHDEIKKENAELKTKLKLAVGQRNYWICEASTSDSTFENRIREADIGLLGVFVS
jgi:hypothetical protein